MVTGGGRSAFTLSQRGFNIEFGFNIDTCDCRQQLERIPRRQAEAAGVASKPLPGSAGGGPGAGGAGGGAGPSAAQVVSHAAATLVDIAAASASSSASSVNSQFLLARYVKAESHFSVEFYRALG